MLIKAIVMISIITTLIGCAAPRQPLNQPEAVASHSDPGAGASEQAPQQIEAHMAATAPGEPIANGADGVIGLQQALAATLRHNAELAAASYRTRGAEAQMLQARKLPNPELGLALEEYDRDGEGFDSAETAIVLGQLIELGGKRRHRIRVAALESDLAQYDYASKRLDLLMETAMRFVEVLAAQQRVQLAASVVELTEQISGAVEERVKAGKEPRLQSVKSRAESEMARMRADEAQRELEAQKAQLAAMWQNREPLFNSVTGNLEQMPEEPPAFSTLRGRLAINPDLARWRDEIRVQRAVLAAEKATRIPDLEASVGFVQFEEDGTDALAFEVGIALPIFDRNQGAIAAARHAVSAAQAERQAAETALLARLSAKHAQLLSAHQRVRTLQDRVIPAMTEALQAAREGYREGKFDFIDMLDAQRGLIDVKSEWVDALHDYHAASIELQRLAATEIETFQ